MDALKILMVDDEERMRKLVKDFLDVYKRQPLMCPKQIVWDRSVVSASFAL